MSPKPARLRVLLQAGHVSPREPGFESGTGTGGEADFVHAVEHKLISLLERDDRFAVTHSHGDIPDGWTGDLFLALHADGSSDTKASGFSFGFPPGCSECKRLADTFAAWYEQIPGAPKRRSDNYTGALSGYYGWRRTNAPAKLLVEHGFLTRPAERDWLFANVDTISMAHYEAILHYFRLDWPEPPAWNRKRLVVLRAWIVERRADGWGWQRLKGTFNWTEWRRRGGR